MVDAHADTDNITRTSIGMRMANSPVHRMSLGYLLDGLQSKVDALAAKLLIVVTAGRAGLHVRGLLRLVKMS